MTLALLPTEMFLPNIATSGDGPGLVSGLLLDVENDAGGIIIQIGDREGGKTIDKLGLRIQTVGTTGDVDARVETVSLTDGLPTGTLATTNSNLVQSVSATGWNEFALTAGHVVATGDFLAIVFVLGATASASITTGESRRTFNFGIGKFPYEVNRIDPSAYIKVNQDSATFHMSYAVGFSDGTWMHNLGSVPVIAFANTTIISTGAAETGLEFQIPFKGTLSGVALNIDRDIDVAMHLGNGSYNPGDTGATRLSTITFDKDIIFSGAIQFERLRFSTPVDLEANTTYRLVIEAPAATNVVIGHMDFNAAALVETMGYNTTFKHILDNQAGGWTTTTTRLPTMALTFSKFDDGAGGGGGGGGRGYPRGAV